MVRQPFCCRATASQSPKNYSFLWTTGGVKKLGPVRLKIGKLGSSYLFGILAFVELAVFGCYLWSKGAKPLSIFWKCFFRSTNLKIHKDSLIKKFSHLLCLSQLPEPLSHGRWILVKIQNLSFPIWIIKVSPQKLNIHWGAILTILRC